MNKLAVTIFCWAVTATLLILAYKALHKDKWGFAGTCVLLGCCFAVFGLPTFQGLGETWLQSAIYSKLTALGEQVNSIQETTGKMQAELNQHQTNIDIHQKELNEQQAKIRIAQKDIASEHSGLTNQFFQLSALETKLTSAQTNIEQEQSALKDVQFLVDNLYSKVTFETLAATDTNRCTVMVLPDGSKRVFFQLKYCPIPKSVQGTVNSLFWPQSLQPPLAITKNILTLGFDSNWNTGTLVLNVQYIPDTRNSNVVKHLDVKGQQLFLDGVPAYFTPQQTDPKEVK